MTDLDSSLQDMISRDEEIEKLEARLAEGQVSSLCSFSSVVCLRGQEAVKTRVSMKRYGHAPPTQAKYGRAYV